MSCSTTSRLIALGDGPDAGDDDLVAVVDGHAERRLDTVVLVDVDVEPLEQVAHVERGDGHLLRLGGTDLDGDLLGCRHVDRQTTAVQARTTADRQRGPREGPTDLLQGAVDVRRGHPVGGGVAVDGELERAAVAHADLGAVADLLVELRSHLVVVADLDAFGGQDVTDGPAEGGDLLGLPVDGHRHGLGHGRVGHRRAGDRDGHDCDEDGHQAALATELVERGKQNTPNVELPGSCVLLPPSIRPTITRR